MEPIRVLHVVTYMGRGGLETMLMNYYRHIDRSKVQFDFLVHRDFEADYDKEIEEFGGRIYRLPKLNPIGKEYLTALGKFFDEHREYKIVHSHLDCMAGIPLKYAKQCGVPIRIGHAHSSSQTKDKKYLLKLFYKRNITKNATQLFACAEAAGKWMFRTNNFRVLNNAIDSEKYVYNPKIAKQIRKELSIPESSFVIGHVGRFAVPKNHEFLIRLFAEICKKEKDARLLLVGDGELREQVEKQIEELSIEDKVILAGVCDNVNELLQAMDVFVFPSIYEGLPVSMIEAQAAGLPCFISDKVPVECVKTDLVQQIRLDVNMDEWIQRILAVKNQERKNYSQEIKEEEFDIVSNAKWLEDYYIDLITDVKSDAKRS